MAYLEITRPGGQIIKMSLNDFLTIGRHQNNHLVLPGEEIENFHACIALTSSGAYVLYGQARSQGVIAQGQPVRALKLSPDATFRIGPYLVSFRQDHEKSIGAVRLAPDLQSPLQQNFNANELLALGKTAGRLGFQPAFSSDRLIQLLEINNQIALLSSQAQLADKALHLAMEAVGAKRAFLALVDGQGGLLFQAMRGFDVGPQGLKVSATMIHHVLNEGQAVMTANAVKEEPYQRAASVLAYNLLSVLCLPLFRQNRVAGCLYLDNPEQEESFQPDDLKFSAILAQQIMLALENARLLKQMQDQQQRLREKVRAQQGVVIRSQNMLSLYAQLKKVAPKPIPVLIRGETGTGKELVARSCHEFSGRKGEFVPFNCAAIAHNLLESELFGCEKGAFTGADRAKAGWVELAHRGTLFLDEIAELSLEAQAKLLRVLEDHKVARVGGTQYREVDVRVVAATNRDLEEMIQRGLFRADLYYRIQTLEFNVSPLRERREDIPVLCQFFLAKLAEEYQTALPCVTDEAMKILMAHDWPGNVRELKNVVIRAALLGDGQSIGPSDLPKALWSGQTAISGEVETLEEVERRHLAKALAAAEGNKKKAAQMLRISRDTMHRKIKKYGL